MVTTPPNKFLFHIIVPPDRYLYKCPLVSLTFERPWGQGKRTVERVLSICICSRISVGGLYASNTSLSRRDRDFHLQSCTHAATEPQCTVRTSEATSDTLPSTIVYMPVSVTSSDECKRFIVQKIERMRKAKRSLQESVPSFPSGCFFWGFVSARLIQAPHPLLHGRG